MKTVTCSIKINNMHRTRHILPIPNQCRPLITDSRLMHGGLDLFSTQFGYG